MVPSSRRLPHRISLAEEGGFEPSAPPVNELVSPAGHACAPGAKAARRASGVQALGVTETRRAADPDTQPTIGFKAIMREAADTRRYAAALSVLVVAEWLYLDWASRAPQPLPNNFVHAEWITLHDNPNFRGFVDFLRTELDRVAPAHADLCRDFFSRAVALELSFFEAAYTT